MPRSASRSSTADVVVDAGHAPQVDVHVAEWGAGAGALAMDDFLSQLATFDNALLT